VPGDRDIGVVEGAGADHEGLRGAAFLGRAAIIAHAAGILFSASQFFIAVAASRAAEPSRLWPQPWPWPPLSISRCSATPASWLRPGRASYSPRNAMTGTAFAGFAHHRGRDVGDVLGDAKALVLQFGECSATERCSV
jgi:hypothetical protein